jgi:cardiolipin synthase
LNEELNLTLFDRALARRLEMKFFEDLKYSRRITHEEWDNRGLKEKFFELFTFPVEEQL